MATLTVRNKTDDTAEISLYGPIGHSFWEEGVTAKDFRDAVKAAKGKLINLRINSPGGSVIEANAMVAALDEFRGKKGRVEVDVDGLAASAASYLAATGDKVRVAANGLVMIHNPMSGVLGTAEDMRKEADLLDKVKGQILNTYLRRAKLTRDELAAAMDAETWYTGEEAVNVGLADEATAPVQVAAFAGMDALLAKMKYKHPPELPQDDAARRETEKRRAVVARLAGGT